MITNVSLHFSKQGKYLRLGNNREILNSEGPLLTICFDLDGSHFDIYLIARCYNSQDYLCIKIDQNCLLQYLEGQISLFSLILSSPISTFYYLWKVSNQEVIFSLPITLIDSYSVYHSSSRIVDLDDGIVLRINIEESLNEINNLKRIDPFGEEKWFVDQIAIKQIRNDACLYLRYIIGSLN